MKTLPTPVRALLQLLGGSIPSPPLGEDEQHELMRLADRTHCTLYLAGHATSERLARNADRHRRLWLAYDEAAAALSANGIEFVLLKGFTHEVDSGLDSARRYQSDLDILCLPEDIARARVALQQTGYREHGPAALSDEHARPLVKPFTWHWRGDYFDPDLPISIELHQTFWSGARDRIGIPDVRKSWNRRTMLAIERRTIPALAETDRIAFAALHVIRHILRNNASPAHVFELAGMLNQRAADQVFWDTWIRAHDADSRSLQTIAFQFARQWFECSLSRVAEQEWQALPPSVHEWFRSYGFSPLVNLVEPNKDVLWLHLAILPRRIDRFAVAFRKLMPMHLRRSSELEGSLSRVRYHAVALARVLTASSRRRPAAPSTASQTSD
jgi:Uncharacterised nucleotidyltransferase